MLSKITSGDVYHKVQALGINLNLTLNAFMVTDTAYHTQL